MPAVATPKTRPIATPADVASLIVALLRRSSLDDAARVLVTRLADHRFRQAVLGAADVLRVRGAVVVRLQRDGALDAIGGDAATSFGRALHALRRRAAGDARTPLFGSDHHITDRPSRASSRAPAGR